MPIVSGDIDFHLSGGSANSDPAASTGGAISTTQISDGGTHNLFDLISSAEAAAGDTEYRCFYVKNNHGSLTLQNSKIYISTDSTGADTDIEIAIDGAGVNGTAETVANESTAPSGESFSTPTSVGSALSIGNIPAGQHIGIWVKRTVSSSASAATGLSATFTVVGDTAA
jgi:hypothetical protein